MKIIIILLLLASNTLACNIIKHTYYNECYSNKYRQSEYVFYTLTDKELVKNVKRANNFHFDPSIKSNPVTKNDYLHSGYDRWHLAPAGDFTFNKIAMNESFYMSNMSPQKPLFNRGIWKKLETKVRTIAKKYKKIHVITGIVVDKRYKSIHNIAVPSAYYKIITYNNKTIAYLLPNKGSKQPLSKYLTTVKHIESLTHIKFKEQ